MFLKTSLSIFLVCYLSGIIDAQGLRHETPIASADNLDSYYDAAQTYFYNKHYDKALEFFKLYLDQSRGVQSDHPRIIWSID